MNDRHYLVADLYDDITIIKAKLRNPSLTDTQKATYKDLIREKQMEIESMNHHNTLPF